MRDFDLSKAKEMLVNYLKWRECYKVDAIPKVVPSSKLGLVSHFVVSY